MKTKMITMVKPSSRVPSLSTVIITMFTITCYPILHHSSCTLSHKGHNDSSSTDTIPIITFGKTYKFMPLLKGNFLYSIRVHFFKNFWLKRQDVYNFVNQHYKDSPCLLKPILSNRKYYLGGWMGWGHEVGGRKSAFTRNFEVRITLKEPLQPSKI